MLVQRVRDLQPADERECGDILTAFENLSQLALEVANIRFEAVALPHLDNEKMVVVPLNLLTRCILGEKCFGHFLKVIERLRRQKIEPIYGRIFQTEREGEAHDRLLWAILSRKCMMC